MSSGLFFTNSGLFSQHYFNRMLSRTTAPIPPEIPENLDSLINLLLTEWKNTRSSYISKVEPGETAKLRPGVPEGYKVLIKSESHVEQGIIRFVMEKTFAFAIDNNTTLSLQGDAGREALNPAGNQRPDFILFPSHDTLNNVSLSVSGKRKNAVEYCAEAVSILDAKSFHLGVYSDEYETGISKVARCETSLKYVTQVERYLRGCRKKWGILTNGRNWRLIRSGKIHEHLRFDLVMFLESILAKGGVIDDYDRWTFTLFYNIFGQPSTTSSAHSGFGFNDRMERECERADGNACDALRENAHKSVELLCRGFWQNPSNEWWDTKIKAPRKPSQAELDELRELSLTYLYRLLFILKAEAQNLLPMRNEKGAATPYAANHSTQSLFLRLKNLSPTERRNSERLFLNMKSLFEAIDKGRDYPDFSIPAYNGGLFDSEKHVRLDRLKLFDDTLFDILKFLIYTGDSYDTPIPYEDLDVRDLGDIYEGLLEQRLFHHQPVAAHEPSDIRLANKKGERKASGSYFTPDPVVDYLCRKAIQPKLDACGCDPLKILELKILDPAMGSAHFLVKSIDIIASHLTLNCDPIDEGAPDDNSDREFAYWKEKVAEKCVYGVDYNPMAVELAKVSIWLHTTSAGRPLSFLDHHLKVGNSLIGAPVAKLNTPSLKSKMTKQGAVWAPATRKPEEQGKAKKGKKRNIVAEAEGIYQMELPLPIDTSLMSGIVKSIREIVDRIETDGGDVKRKGKDYTEFVERRIAAHKLLADLWCAQWLIFDPEQDAVMAYESPSGLYAKVREICGLRDDSQRLAELDKLANDPIIQKLRNAVRSGFGPRPLAFFHWQFEFPEVAFDATGNQRSGFGFDIVLGNPPWDKIKPAKRDFYGPYSEEVANTQGQSLDNLIARLETETPELADGWKRYESAMVKTADYLGECGEFPAQKAFVDGAKTGGDPDLYKYFVERFFQVLSGDGRLGIVIPGVIWQSEGCTGLRSMLFEKKTIDELFVFENYRKWAFNIDSRFKFSTIVASNTLPPEGHSFNAAFMLRDPQILGGSQSERVVKLSLPMIKALSPESLALLDFKSSAEAGLMARMHQSFPRLDSPDSGWNPKYRCDLHMTHDSWLFKKPEWMRERGFVLVRPKRTPDGWGQELVEFSGGNEKTHDQDSPIRLPSVLPPGGEYWVSANPEYYVNRGYNPVEAKIQGTPLTVFVHPDDLAKPVRIINKKHVSSSEIYRILPSSCYTALYEGRMVDNFDHCAKKYIGGEGRKAIWNELGCKDKALQSHFFVALAEALQPSKWRIGFCEITGATNERTLLVSPMPKSSVCGNKVPTLTIEDMPKTVIITTLLSSFVLDSFIRMRVTTTLNYIYVRQLPMVPFSKIPQDVIEKALRLSCTTPELADYWNEAYPENPWTYESAERDPWKRAELRAEIDAIVAEAYGLSIEEYARVLTGFPLLDRDQPALEGDMFLTESEEGRKKSVKTSNGYFELTPRSFITRDFALMKYIQRRKGVIPSNLESWFKDKVGLDPNGPLSRFRIGTIKDLETRINATRRLGAVPYSSSDADEEAMPAEGEASPD